MDHLKHLFEKPALSGRLSRWLILLAKFNLKYMARKTIKGSVVSDFCAKNPIKGEDGKEDFPDEDILHVELGIWKMYFDGAVNQYANGIGVLLITLEGSHIPLAVKLNFEVTNNMAEYRACISRVEALRELRVNINHQPNKQGSLTSSKDTYMWCPSKAHASNFSGWLVPLVFHLYLYLF